MHFLARIKLDSLDRRFVGQAALLALLLLAGCASPPEPAPDVCVPARDSNGRIARSKAVVAEFKRITPCPVTGKPERVCAGYIVDHIKPLCACGPDALANLQYQTVADAKEKDKWERKLCGGD